MKFKIILVTIIAVLLNSCAVFQCDYIEDVEITFLVDISDGRLLETAKTDIQKNLPVFMSKLGFIQLESCQRLTVHIAPLSAKDEFRVKSATIGLTDKNMSGKDRRNQSNPRPIVEMLNTSLEEFGSLQELPEYTSGSSIGNQILKAVKLSKNADRSYVVVLSDLIQHDSHISFYKQIPKQIDTETLQQLFDPVLLQEFEETNQGKGQSSRIILVQLQTVDQSMNGKRREIASLWQSVFTDFLEADFELIDNLSN